ncbi:MAG: endo-1,4-beta-xylanase [Treponema sp.]|nr:endo-1,4-beta-xylanase [Treponema sp.]
MTPLLFLSQQSPVNNVNGFTADPGSYEILSNYQGKNNVLKVDVSKAQGVLARYSLDQYRGRPITIEFSADVRREGSSGTLMWQMSNSPYYPEITAIQNAEPNKWHNMRGRVIVTPAQNGWSAIYLTNWGVPLNTTIYIANPIVTITTGNPFTPDFSLTSLKTIYTNHFKIGNIINDEYMTESYYNLLKHHYNSVIPQYNLVPSFLAPANKGGVYQWTDADRIVNQAIKDNMEVAHGMHLVWHESTPAWMTEGTREEVIQNMNNYITTVVRHFRGRINSWVVVNEAVRDGLTTRDARGDWRNCLNDSQNRINIHSPNNEWYNKLGSDYIELAFRAARAADPEITLYYNDHGLEDVNKAEVVRKMIQDINDRYKRETRGNRNLIDGVGSQAHIYDLNLNMNNVRAALDKLVSLGIEISITEMDIPIGGWPDVGEARGLDSVMSESDAIAQALLYARLMQLYKEYSSHISRVSFWCMDDNRSWLSKGNPTLFDFHLNAKLSFHAVSDPDGFIRQYGGRTRR